MCRGYSLYVPRKSRRRSLHYLVVFMFILNQILAYFVATHLYTSVFSLLIMLFLLLGICFNIVNQVIFDCHCKTNHNRILGALSLYLMIGLSWAIIYFLCVKVSPYSIHGLIDSHNYNLLFINAIYYSFVTITSLGYGDMYPISPILKVFSFIESIMGLFYIAACCGYIYSYLFSFNHSFIKIT